MVLNSPHVYVHVHHFQILRNLYSTFVFTSYTCQFQCIKQNINLFGLTSYMFSLDSWGHGQSDWGTFEILRIY